MEKIYVRAKGPEDRLGIISFPEDGGYTLDKGESRSKEEILGSLLPIAVNPANKSYSMMGNVTVAAAAASGGVLVTKEEFYKQFEDMNKVNPKEEEEGIS